MIFKLCTLCSGSSGNCTYIRYGNDEILIDAGKNAKYISEKLAMLGSNVQNIGAILITHEHSDHISALNVLAKRTNAVIYAPKECKNKMSAFSGRVEFFEMPAQITVGGITAVPFKTSHDSDGCVGYTVMLNGFYIGIASDTGCITRTLLESLGGCRYAIIEANYDDDMLIHGPYCEALKQRILSKLGHLSNKDCARLAAALFNSGTEHIALCHLSKDNNTPQAAIKTVSDKLSEYGIYGNVCVCSREEITEIANLDI